MLILILALFSLCLAQPLTPSTVATTNIRPVTAFQTLEGRTSDPCARLLNPGDADCMSVPDGQVTILLPSQSSSHPAGNLLRTNQYTLTIFGTGFDTFPTDGDIAVTTPGAPCGGAAAAVTPSTPVSGRTSTQITFVVPIAWTQAGRENEASPRSLCYRTGGALQPWKYTGFKIGVVWHCDPTNNLNCASTARLTGPVAQQLTFEQWRAQVARMTCCPGALGTLKVGQCILSPSDNPLSPTACCGGAAIEVATSRCCNSGMEFVAFTTSPCPCWGPSLPSSPNPTSCPTGESCCLPVKYTELSASATNAASQTMGQCYNPNTHKCCDTGMRYDPGTFRCCVINGLQSVNVPCPCSVDLHCWSGVVADTKQTQLRCCKQTNTTEVNELEACTIYANYPNGTGAYQAQRCHGTCFDPTYQICCNGAQCIKSFEKCCNNTCCNRFTQTCDTALRSAAPGNRWNWNDFLVRYETCSTIEQMQPIKSMWIYVFPTLWLLMTLLGTALVLVFANKASSRSYAAIEKAMINIAVIAIIFSICLYFSPAYKYAVVLVFVQLFTILTAAARIKQLNIWCLVLQLVLAIYLVDPFHGNRYLTLASGRRFDGQPDRDSAGLIHLIGKMYKSFWLTQTDQFCSHYYLEYFRLDPQMRDLDRYDNPANLVFGYCDRAYVLLLLVFCALMYIAVLLQLILTLLALLLRFTKPQVKLVVREEYESDYGY